METITVFDANATASLLDFTALVDALAVASGQHDAGDIHSPVRTGVPLNGNGVVLSMPASADDIAIHKLVSVSPDNVTENLPTIFGTVTVCNGKTGRPEFILDGPTVTSRRTAALSMLGVRALHPSTPSVFLIIGTGQQAQTHALAIHALYPDARVLVKGLNASFESAFCEALDSQGVNVEPCGENIPPEVDTVITLTTSKVPVYTEAAKASRLVIGVGAFTPDAAEIAPETVRASSVFVDDLNATRAEAGDLIQADVDWSQVRTLGSAASQEVRNDGPILLKTVGSGAWDLAACRVARAALK